MIRDSAHGGSWIRDIYYYFGFGKIWHFERDAELSPPSNGIQKVSDEGLPFSKRFVFVDGEPDNEIYNENSVKEIRKELEEQSKKAAIDRSTVRYFKGELGGWKYSIRMELKIEGNGKITGQYKYQKGGSSLKLEGQLTEERFEIVEKNEKGKITGRFKGRFINRTTAKGRWFSPDGKTDHYLDMEPTETYSFK